jgi:hypothetical protein
MRNVISNDSIVVQPGEDGHGGEAAMASSRHRKRGRGT